EERLVGRYLVEDLVDRKTGEVLMDCDHMLTEDDAEVVAKYVKETHAEDIAAGNAEEGSRAEIDIRSLLTCRAHHGVCIKCYGKNLATGGAVTVGEAVGIIAAQSIGEPGTQLTMRTVHTGGVASGSDITQGLPRVEELFEGRKPKTLAILSEFDGTVSIDDDKKGKHVIVTNAEEGKEKSYLIPYGLRLRQKIVAGATVQKGEALTEGSVNPHDLLEIMGVDAVHDYLIREVQRVYRMQGVDINDKHIEVIVRQMMKKVTVTDAGETDLIAGSVIEKSDFYAVNEKLEKEAAETGREPAYAKADPMLLGITKASLATDSFLSAASFQETTRVLTDAAIKGKTDPLLGLKENVIIGKLLPSGTGMKCYADVEVEQKHDLFNAIDSELFIEDIEEFEDMTEEE
ncbi:MAG: DNA-directed RNA polymerase subunit beta', partial [Acutalibacteraceae bacterium]|nr:DNA-directed RNA polymerase subunit beta' [Acutalibacteraceae bacterium]